MSKAPEFKTLEEAQQFLRDNWDEGATCPCCKQFVKMYKHKINGIATSDLIRLYRLSKGNVGQPFHVSKFSQDRGGAFAKLAHWGLVETEVNDNTKKRTSGMWSLTYKGLEFVKGDITVPEKIALYNKKAYGSSEKQVDIRTALGTKFDYEELMNS